MMRRYGAFSCLIVALTAPAGVYAEDFDNGGINDIDYPINGGTGNARVFDSTLGETTTLNALAGAQINGVEANDTSLVNILPGSLISADLNANQTAMVTITGGELIRADANDDSELNISGGVFTGSGGRAIGAFDTALVNISGGDFTGTTTFTVQANDMSTINVHSGNIAGAVQANHDSMLNIWGGAGITDIGAAEQALVKVYGTGFALGSIGAISLVDPFIIFDNTYNGQVLSGFLADGSPISASIFNGIKGSEIVLMQAVPLPMTAALLASGVAGIIGSRRPLRRGPGHVVAGCKQPGFDVV